jgi:hypothetical protein
MAIEKHWFTVEYMVKLLERSISPESRVEHNVFVPDLRSTTGGTRQCDVLISTGVPPRETKILVEVQNRKDKVELNDFLGWITKMQDIGAQQLFCVSTTGFSESIIDRAKQYGGTVRLITLKHENTKFMPIKIFSFKSRFNNYKKTINSAKITGVDANKKFLKGIKIPMEEKAFYYPNNNIKRSIPELLTDYLEKHGYQFEGTKETTFPGAGSKLLIDVNGKPVAVIVRCSYTMKNEITEGDSNVYSYEQLGDGTLAWLLTSECKVKTNNTVVSYNSSVPATLNPDGSFRVREVSIVVKLD